MTVDLGVFYTERPHRDEDAGERYLALCSTNAASSWIEPSPSIADFYVELTAKFPDDGSTMDPWSTSPLDRSEGHVIMSMPARRASRIIPIVIDLARKHGLVCFDPQSGRILTAPPGIRISETEPPSVQAEGTPRPEIVHHVDVLNAVLGAQGFKRRERIWYRDGVNTISALEFDDVSGAPEIWMFVWFKSKGDIDAAQVGPGKRRHLVQDLRDALPKRMKWRLSHVLQPEMYSAAPNPHNPAKRSEWENTFRMLLEDYAVAWFDRIEANPGAYHGWGRFWRRIRAALGGS